MCCCLMKCVLKLVIGIINGLFLTIGVLLSAAGGVMLAISNGVGPAKDLLKMILDVLASIKIVAPVPVAELDEAGTFRSAGTAILVVGLFITGIAVIGYCGLSCYSIFLKVYLFILVVLLIIQIVLVALFFSHALDGAMKSGAMMIVRDHYVDIDHFGLYSVISNVIMISAKCCGVYNYTDFYEAKHWNRTREILDERNQPRMASLTTPIACCKMNGTFPDVSVIDFHCADLPNEDSSNFYIGCFKKVTDYVHDQYRTYAILLTTAVLLIQALLIGGVLLILNASSSSSSKT